MDLETLYEMLRAMINRLTPKLMKDFKRFVRVVHPQVKAIVEQCDCPTCHRNLKYLTDLKEAKTIEQIKRISKDYEREIDYDNSIRN